MNWHSLASGPAPGLGTPGGVHLNSAVVTGLIVDIPSTIIAVAAYFLSVRSGRDAASASRVQIDAEAYTRAKDLYESAIAALRQQVDDLRGEVAALRGQLDRVTAQLRRRAR